MNIMKLTLLLIVTFALSFSSCNVGRQESQLLSRMDSIKQRGDTCPAEALTELKKMENEAESSSGYIWNKYHLLEIRLQDKSDMIPRSPDAIESIVHYFDRRGSDEERMEAYYYQGSVYRDLKDYPRAVTSFLTVLDIAQKCKAKPCALLQNTYSQLSWLYNGQMLYDEAMKMAKAGCRMAEQTKTVDPIHLMDISSAAVYSGDTLECIKYCDKALECIKRDTVCKYLSVVCEMLIRYSDEDMRDKAEDCLRILRSNKESSKSPNYLRAMARYYADFGLEDSSALFHKRVISESGNIYQKENSCKYLLYYYYDKKNYEECSRYSMLFCSYVDSTYNEKLYEQTSRACGEHLYAVSRAKELQAQSEADKYERTALVAIIVVLLVFLLANILYRRKRVELKGKTTALEDAHEAIIEYDKRLKTSQNSVEDQKRKLAAMEDKANNIERELKDKIKEAEDVISQQESRFNALNEIIAENEKNLAKKQKQINDLVLLSMHENACTEKHEILQKFIDASYGIGHVSEPDWTSLRTVIESSYPGFTEKIMAMPRISEKSVKTACLIKIGMKNSQIAALTDCPKQTVSDRVKKIKGYLGDVPSVKK